MAQRRARAKDDDSSRPTDTGARLRSRGVALGAGAIVWLALVFAYVWPAWAMALYVLIVDGGVLLAWLAAAAGIGSWLLPLFGATKPGIADSAMLRFVSGTALGLGAMSLGMLGLGLAGWMNGATAIALLAVGIAAGIARLARVRWRVETASQWLARAAGWGWLALLAAPFAAVMVSGAMLPPPMLWTPQEPHGYDVVEYHLQVPREWFEAGRIVPLHHNVFSFFPFNVEVHYLLAMHLRGGPWAGMYLAQLMHGAFIGLTVLAVAALAGRFARDRNPDRVADGTVASIVGLLAASSTPWLAQLGAIAYDEGGFLLFGTLAIGWAALALGGTERRTRRFALAGAMAGLACGCKLTAVPEVLAGIGVCAAAVLLVRRAEGEPSRRARAAGIVVFGLVGLLSFAPWLIRTWAWSGNPVFPELPSLLGRGHFSEVQVERWRRAHAPQPPERPIGARLAKFRGEVLLGWQYGYLVIPLGLAGIVAGRRAPQVWFLGALLVLLAVFWIGFTHLQGRFFILAVPVLALLTARLPWPGLILVVIQAAVGFVLLHAHFVPHMIPAAVAIEGDTMARVFEPAAAQSIPAGAPMLLVGDGRAFLYADRPMSTLAYRTVFNADTSQGRGVVDAWAGRSGSTDRWLLIDPGELGRFEKTYLPFPQLPPWISGRAEPFVVQPGAADAEKLIRASTSAR